MTFHYRVFRCWVFRRWAFRRWVFPAVGYSRCWIFRTVTDDIPLLGILSLGIPLLGIPVILPGIPTDQNTQLFCWVFWSLGIPDVGYSVQLPRASYDSIDNKQNVCGK